MLPRRTFDVGLIDRINRSRFFSISLGFHLLLVLLLGGTVLYKAIQEPSDFESDGTEFVKTTVQAPRPQNIPAPQPSFIPQVAPPQPGTPINPIIIIALDPLEFYPQPPARPAMDRILHGRGNPIPSLVSSKEVPQAPGMTGADLAALTEFTDWKPGNGTSADRGLREQEFEFVAFLGKYQGGNWNSTVQVRNNEVIRGSLPNLLYYMSKTSANKIKTNERAVRVISLDSDELIAARPPFVFITGTRDFTLTAKEVENLRKYVRLGGAIWGDSSVPGKRSRFDIAFRREMKRVIPDVDKDFEPLPSNHPIYARGYYPNIKQAPAGMNYYSEPVYALKIFGEVAILYTANDYGDMMQVGLSPDGEVDLGRDQSGSYVATNASIWDNRDIYMNNVTESSVKQSYEFGTNIVIHLLTRWEKIKSATRL